MRLFYVSTLVLTVALFAQDPEHTFEIENVCDTLTLGLSPKVTLTAAYIDESNWYGNPHTWVADSTNFKRHESYETLEIKSDKFNYRLPVSITAGCVVSQLNELNYVSWNSSKKWVEKSNDSYATVIRTMRQMGVGSYDSTNAFNSLAMVVNGLPEDDSYNSGEILISRTYDFAFEWWFVGVSYQLISAVDESSVRIINRYTNSIAYDSLTAARSAIAALPNTNMPDTVRTVRIQAVKVVLTDPRHVVESSSSEQEVSSSSVPSTVSSSSTDVSSSSVPPTVSSSSMVVSSSSVPPTVSSSGTGVSSSSVPPAISSSSVVASSSSKTPAESSSAEAPKSSSSVEAPKSSSSNEPKISSNSENPKVSSSSKAPEESSSSKVPEESSSSEKASSSSQKSGGSSSSAKDSKESIPVRGSIAVPETVVQMRRLDGSVVVNAKMAAPGIYYVQTSSGVWMKKAVLPK